MKENWKMKNAVATAALRVLEPGRMFQYPEFVVHYIIFLVIGCLIVTAFGGSLYCLNHLSVSGKEFSCLKLWDPVLSNYITQLRSISEMRLFFSWNYHFNTLEFSGYSWWSVFIVALSVLLLVGTAVIYCYLSAKREVREWKSMSRIQKWSIAYSIKRIN